MIAAKRKPGRPRLAPGDGPSEGQAMLRARVPAEVAEWVKALPGGLGALVLREYGRREKS